MIHQKYRKAVLFFALMLAMQNRGVTAAIFLPVSCGVFLDQFAGRGKPETNAMAYEEAKLGPTMSMKL